MITGKQTADIRYNQDPADDPACQQAANNWRKNSCRGLIYVLPRV